MTDEEFAARVGTLTHALQSGVVADHRLGSRDGEPKHLRVGVNVALVETGAIGRLLIEKGVCTREEYQTSVLVGLEAEIETYQARLSKIYGTKVSLA